MYFEVLVFYGKGKIFLNSTKSWVREMWWGRDGLGHLEMFLSRHRYLFKPTPNPWTFKLESRGTDP